MTGSMGQIAYSVSSDFIGTIENGGDVTPTFNDEDLLEDNDVP